MIARADNLGGHTAPAVDPATAGDLLARPLNMAALPRLFWSIVQAPAKVRPGPIPLGIAAEAQADIPVELSELHAVGAPTRTGEPRLLVCAARRADLAAYLDGPETLCPAEVPEFARDLGVDPHELNLLVGEFLPLPMRRRRERRHLVGAMVVLACAALLWVGLHRREAAASARATAANGQRDAMLAELGQHLKSPLDLQRRVNELGQLKFALDSAQVTLDAADALSSVLQAWPASAAPSPQSVGVQQSVVAASFSVEGDVARALDALTSAPWPAGWSLQPPQIAKAGDRTRVTVELRRATPEPGTKGAQQ